MKHNIAKLILFFITIITPVASLTAADDVIFTAQAESTVIAGEPFRLQFQVNASGKNFQLPDIKGFEIISGPQTSTSSSTQIVNGKVTRSKSTIYTYILLAEKEGQYTIPAASVTVDKERYRSNTLTIKVLPEDKTGNTAADNRQSGSSRRGQNISADNLFVKAIASRTNVYEQEAIVLTYKLYFRVDLTNIQPIEFPDFNGFLVQEIELQPDRRPQVENYNGLNYSTYEIRKVLLFPQHAGIHKIDAMKTNVIVRLQNQHQQRSFFDSFFDTYQEVEKRLETPALNITVKALPVPKPSNFSGVVGSLSMTSDITTQEVNTNEPITITLKVSGSGNMKMLKNPEMNFPTDFETYEPKVSNQYTSGTKGLSGTKTIEYLAIPRHDGTFTIPATTMSYYDIASDGYKTVSTPSYTITVNKGNATEQTPVVVGNFNKSEKVTITATDIRFIKTRPLKIEVQNRLIAGTPLYWMMFAIPLVAAVVLALFFRKQIRESADIALMRNKKANKVARRRLAIANKYAAAGDKIHFFDEILKALWGYLSDKLGIPVAELNKDNITASLESYNISSDVIERFVSILNECEYQRYAPSPDTQAVMDKIYGTALSLISELENSVKRRSRTKRKD